MKFASRPTVRNNLDNVTKFSAAVDTGHRLVIRVYLLVCIRNVYEILLVKSLRCLTNFNLLLAHVVRLPRLRSFLADQTAGIDKSDAQCTNSTARVWPKSTVSHSSGIYRRLTQSLVTATLAIGSLNTALALTCNTAISPVNPDIAYVVHGDETVTDTRSGLRWKVCAEGQTWESGTCVGRPADYRWAEALSQAEATTFAGASDWRLPNIRELRSLIEECRFASSINDTIFPGAPESSFFWSSSPLAGVPNLAWSVYFGGGNSGGDNRGNYFNVRLVRGGPSFGNFVFGACGSAAGVASLVTPTTGLCTAGTAGTLMNSGGNWSWTCSGANGGGDANCSTALATCSLYVVGANGTTAAIDAVILIRYLLGVRGDALAAGLTPLGTRYTGALLQAFIGTGAQFDVVGRAVAGPTAMIDGLILLRLMLGFPDTALLNGITLPAGSPFTNASQIRANVNLKCGGAY
jgi:hypothetical protein